MPSAPGAAGTSGAQAGDVAQAVAVPDFVDPDEAAVRAWFGGYDETGGAKSRPAGNYQASSAWVSTVLDRPSRPGRLGLGAEPPKRKVEEEIATAPVGKAARRLLGRRKRIEEEETDARRWAQRGGRGGGLGQSSGSGRGGGDTASAAATAPQSAVGAGRGRDGHRGKRAAKNNDHSSDNDDEDEEEELGRASSTNNANTNGKRPGGPQDALSAALAQAAAPSESASSRTRKRAEKKKRQKERARGDVLAGAAE